MTNHNNRFFTYNLLKLALWFSFGISGVIYFILYYATGDYLDQEENDAFIEWFKLTMVSGIFLIIAVVSPWPALSVSLIIVSMMNYYRYILNELLEAYEEKYLG